MHSYMFARCCLILSLYRTAPPLRCGGVASPTRYIYKMYQVSVRPCVQRAIMYQLPVRPHLLDEFAGRPKATVNRNIDRIGYGIESIESGPWPLGCKLYIPERYGKSIESNRSTKSNHGRSYRSNRGGPDNQFDDACDGGQEMNLYIIPMVKKD